MPIRKYKYKVVSPYGITYWYDKTYTAKEKPEIKESDKEAIIKLYRLGVGIKQISKIFGITSYFIKKITDNEQVLNEKETVLKLLNEP